MAGLVILGVSAALLAQADDANQNYVECMFSVARNAPADMPEGPLSDLLHRSCQRERSGLHAVTVQIRTQRGSSPSQAEAEWRQLEQNTVASIVRAHYQAGRLGSTR